MHIDALIAALQEMIRAEGGPPQSRLPTERDLAARFGVPRRTMRKALAQLEADGQIWRHVGMGTFVGSRPTIPGKIPDLAQATPSELIEARLLLEPNLAALAAMRATSSLVDQLRMAASKCGRAPTLDSYEKWDQVFHRSIAMATANGLLISIFEIINELRHGIVMDPERDRKVWRNHQKMFMAQHHAIAEAIASRKPRVAYNAMRQHLQFMESIYFDFESLRFGSDQEFDAI